jgi:hypothetical protein
MFVDTSANIVLKEIMIVVLNELSSCIDEIDRIYLTLFVDAQTLGTLLLDDLIGTGAMNELTSISVSIGILLMIETIVRDVRRRWRGGG